MEYQHVTNITVSKYDIDMPLTKNKVRSCKGCWKLENVVFYLLLLPMATTMNRSYSASPISIPCPGVIPQYQEPATTKWQQYRWYNNWRVKRKTCSISIKYLLSLKDFVLWWKRREFWRLQSREYGRENAITVDFTNTRLIINGVN